MSNFKETPLINSGIHEVSSRLFAYDNNKVIEVGTCVHIARNLSITAKHVIEEVLSQFKKDKDGNTDVHFWIARTFSGPEYAVWEIDVTWMSYHTDVAFLHFKPYNDIATNNPFTKQVMIDFTPPRVGDTLVGFGYSGNFTESKLKIDENGKHIEINSKPFTTIGLVEEIYPEKRDDSLLNFPSLRVGFKSEHGMSGGPVFNNKTGHLVGIISTGWDGQEMANICLLWPSVITEISLNNKNQTILEYIDQDIIKCIGRDKITFSPQFSFLYKK